MNISFLMVASETSECVRNVVDSLNAAIAEYPIKYSHEILVCSFSPIQYENVTWVEDQLKQKGNTVQALNSMVPVSKGEYIYLLSDDHMFPNPNPIRAVEFLESDVFKNRKCRATSICSGPNTNSVAHRMGATAIPNLNLWHTNPERFMDHAAFPEELKHPRFCSVEHRYLIMGYPVFARETVMDHLGGCVFNPSFRHHWADSWLPFYVGETDGYMPVCEDTPLLWCPRPGPTSDVNNDLHDYYVYCKLAVKLLTEGCTYHEKVTIDKI